MQVNTHVIPFDCHYIHPGRFSAYLLEDGGEAAFVEAGTPHALPLFLDALQANGLAPGQVRYIILTHIHLDHAAGASALAAVCPNATVLVHPRGVRHLAHPERLIEATRVVYGPERFASLFGEILPLPEARLRAVEDGETIWLGKRPLVMMHTLGHARHHICIYDSASAGVFTGDVFGSCYPEFRQGAKPLFLCAATPTEFDPNATLETMERLFATGAQRVYLSHYGPVEDIQTCAASLRASIEDMAAILVEAAASDAPDEALGAFCYERLQQAMAVHFQRHGMAYAPNNAAWFEDELALDAQGLAHVATQRRLAK